MKEVSIYLPGLQEDFSSSSFAVYAQIMTRVPFILRSYMPATVEA